MDSNTTIVLKTKADLSPINYSGAISIRNNKYKGNNNIPYFDEEQNEWLLDTDLKDFNSISIKKNKTSESNPVDASKRLEDSGMQMLPVDEAKKYLDELKKEKDEMKLILDEVRARDFLKKHETAEIEKSQLEIAQKEDKIFAKSIEEQGTVSMTIQRRRNNSKESTELRTSKYNMKTGALELDGNGKPINTEFIIIIINGKKFAPAHLVPGTNYNIPSFDLGQDFGEQEGLLMLTDIPWCVACALSEKRLTHKLVNAKTGQVYKSPFKGGSHEAQLLHISDGEEYWKHQI
jgi:hypothetical protein